ncbi:MAG: hypothetical protein J0G32_06380, partial [Alphaproteobacteria bacterium]|nr:hypothetical protein [Alphaproteobacteria bacterium]
LLTYLNSFDVQERTVRIVAIKKPQIVDIKENSSVKLIPFAITLKYLTSTPIIFSPATADSKSTNYF